MDTSNNISDDFIYTNVNDFQLKNNFSSIPNLNNNIPESLNESIKKNRNQLSYKNKKKNKIKNNKGLHVHFFVI